MWNKTATLALALAASLAAAGAVLADESPKAGTSTTAVDQASNSPSAKMKAASMAAKKLTLHEADELLSAGNLDEAIAAFQAMGPMRTKKAETWRLNNWGLCLLKQGKYADAAPLLEKSVAADPDNSVAWNNLGVAYENTGQLDKAIDAYKKSVEAAKASHEDGSKASANLATAQAKNSAPASVKKGSGKAAADAGGNSADSKAGSGGENPAQGAGH